MADKPQQPRPPVGKKAVIERKDSLAFLRLATDLLLEVSR